MSRANVKLRTEKILSSMVINKEKVGETRVSSFVSDALLCIYLPALRLIDTERNSFEYKMSCAHVDPLK